MRAHIAKLDAHFSIAGPPFIAHRKLPSRCFRDRFDPWSRLFVWPDDDAILVGCAHPIRDRRRRRKRLRFKSRWHHLAQPPDAMQMRLDREHAVEIPPEDVAEDA